MVAQRKTVNLRLLVGKDERTDPKQVDPATSLSALNNADLSEAGAVKKRRAYDRTDEGQWPLGSTERQLVFGLPAFELAEVGADDAYAYLGALPQMTRTELISDVTRSLERPHSCVGYDGSNYAAYRATRSGTVTYALARWSETGFRFWEVTPIGTVPMKVLPWEDGGAHGVWAFWVTANTLRAQRYNADGSAPSAAFTIATSVISPFDVCATSYALGYVSVGRSAVTEILTFSMDLTDPAASAATLINTTGTGAAPAQVACNTMSGGNVVVAFQTATGGVRMYNATLGSTVLVLNAGATAQVYGLAVGRYGAAAVVVFTWLDLALTAGGTGTRIYHTTITATPSLTASGVAYRAANVAQPVSGGLSTYLVLSAGGSYVLARIGDAAATIDVWPAAAFAHDEAADVLPTDVVPTMTLVGTDRVRLVLTKLAHFSTFNGSLVERGGIALWDFDFRLRNGYDTTDVHGLQLIAGAAPVVFDGRNVMLAGHPLRPSLTATANGAGSMTSGVSYIYAAVYELMDARGNVWRSPPSALVTVAMGGNTAVDLTIQCAANRIRNVLWPTEYEISVAVYRNTQAAPATFRRVTSPSGGAAPVTGDWNDAAAGLAHTDTLSDTTISAHELLYTTGGALEHAPLPPLRCVERHRNRAWGVHAETGDVLPSKLLVPGDGIHFAAGLAVANPLRGQVANALISTEASLLVIYDHTIGHIYGDGPDDLGQGGAFSEIEFIPGSKYGAYSPHVVEATPHGVVLVDAIAGPLLMPYGGTPQRIGQQLAIADYGLDTIISVDYLSARDEVRFTRRDGTYLSWWPGLGGMWGDGETGSYTGAASVDLTAVWSGAHVVSGGSYVYFEVDTGDNSNERLMVAPELSFATAWIKLADLPGVQGRFRLRDIYLIGEYVGPHDLDVTLAYDYDDADTYAVAYTNAELAALSPYQIRIKPSREQLQAVKITVAESTISGSYPKGFKLSQIALDFALYRTGGGKPRVPAGAYK